MPLLEGGDLATPVLLADILDQVVHRVLIVLRVSMGTLRAKLLRIMRVLLHVLQVNMEL
tara:strand:+ start:2094 stop:2270 length:177 start_codon:yes stop_codon:yes gene_type:complete